FGSACLVVRGCDWPHRCEFPQTEIYNGAAMKKTWSIVVIYEDTATREHAVRACDHLVKRFWAEGELDVTWWSCAMLAEPALARQGVEKAVQADLIILSLCRDRELASRVSEWIESWLSP